MPAPDVAEYVDLTLFDIDAQPLVDRAMAEAEIAFPDWSPREGNTEVVLIEALAVEIAELVHAVNRVPGAVTEVLLRLFGLGRDPGVAPTGTATLTVSDTTGHAIAAGTRLRLVLDPDLGSLDFTTDTELVVGVGLASGVVGITGEYPTALGGGTPALTALQVIDAVPYLDRALLAAPLGTGVEPEDGQAFLDRGAARLQRLVTTLVLPEHFTASAQEEVYVVRATTLDNFDSTVGSGSPGSHPGHVTVAVAGPAGAAVSAPNKALLDTKLESQALAALSIHVMDTTLNTVPVTVTVQREVGAGDADVQAAVAAALGEYLGTDAWDFGGTVYRNELISVIDGAAGVARVVTLAAPAADLVLTGLAPLASLGAVATTVQAP